MAGPTMSTRSSGELNLERLGSWLLPHLGVDPNTSIQAQIVSGGRSNLTFVLRVEDYEQEWILRRPPLGRRLPTAHNMRREYRVLSGLGPADVPTPRVIAMCEDEEVIGAPFYVMERVPGRVLRDPEEVDLTPEQADGCGRELVRTLAHLHLADYERLGLGGLGHPEGYMERQLGRWHEQLERSRVRPLPALDELGTRLAIGVPSDGRAALLHGDYRIDNVILDAADPTAIRAVLDWEMATLGDPLADLGMLLMYWDEPGERHPSRVHEIPARAGFPSRAEARECYARETGWDLEGLDYHVAFAHFKLAVIVEGIHARHLEGLTVGGGFEDISTIAPILAQRGLEVLE